MKLFEIFDTTVPIKWKEWRQDDENVQYKVGYFNIDDHNYKLVFRISDDMTYKDEPIHSVAFRSLTTGIKRTKGNAASKVFSAVINGIKEYIGNESPGSIWFTPADIKLEKIYEDHIIPHILQDYPDYMLLRTTTKLDGSTLFGIVRK